MLASPHEHFVTETAMHGKRAGGTGQPIWARIERTLARDIEKRRFNPGERLHSEHVLAERFGVNRHTVRQAIGSLAAKGLLRVEHGVGTFVADFALEYTLGRRTRFNANVSAAGESGRHRLVESRTEKASRQVAKRLRIAPGSRVIYALSVGEVNGRPISLAEHWFPAIRFRDIIERFRQLGSLSAAFAELGIPDYERERSVISAVLPDEAARQQLSVPATRPVLVVESVNVDPYGVPIEYGRTQFCADRVQLVVEPGR